MKVLDAPEARALPVKAKVGFSLRGAGVGFVVLVVYGGGLWFLWRDGGVPLPAILLNIPFWALFFWLWQRNLRRVLTGERAFALAVTDRSVAAPLFGIDRSCPPELDRYVEVPVTEVAEATFVDIRTIVRHRFGTDLTIESVITPVLRLRLRVPVSPELRAAIDAMAGRSGVQGNHVHIAGDQCLEVLCSRSQASAVVALLARIGLKPRTVKEDHDLRDTLDDDALARLESFGHTVKVDSARRLAAEARPALPQ